MICHMDKDVRQTSRIFFQILKTETRIGLYSNLEVMIKKLLETPTIGPNELQDISERSEWNEKPNLTLNVRIWGVGVRG